MPNRPSQSEQTILAVLLESGPSTAAQLQSALCNETDWSYSTIMTFLRRLESKGLVTHEKREGTRAYVYRATSLAGAARGRALRDIVDRFFGGNPLPLLSSLLEERKMNREQIEDLRRLIDEHLDKENKP